MLRMRLTTPVNIAMKVPERICASSAKELSEVKATAVYSDGSTAVKQVEWNRPQCLCERRERGYLEYLSRETGH